MTTRELTRIALMGTILYVVFHAFSDILYLELITFTILSFAQVFSRRDTVIACVLFASLKRVRKGRTIALALTAGIGSFLIGQLVDLPFILFSSTITALYLLMGLKTSLIQGFLTFLATLFLYEPVHRVLLRLKDK